MAEFSVFDFQCRQGGRFQVKGGMKFQGFTFEVAACRRGPLGQET
ncbi:MAG: hypothetical protein WCS65_09105 [Verrucomicrobiae bacterium]